MKIGFLGGSFDPVHYGHLIAAQDAYEQHGLDRVVFVPAARTPLKEEPTRASGDDRLCLLRVAVARDPRFDVSDYELRRGGVSYTIDSVLHFRTQFLDADFFWIVGSDQLPQLHRWKEIDQLVDLIEFIVLERPGHLTQSLPKIEKLKLHRCVGHLAEISSTEIRTRVRRGLPLDYFMPQETARLIEQKALYR